MVTQVFYLPWILWTFFVFLLANPNLRFFSELSLQQFAAGGIALILFSQKINARNSIRSALIVMFTLLLIQILGILDLLPFSKHISHKSIFGQENAFQFTNLIGIATSIYSYFWVEKNAKWRSFALITAFLGLASLITGDFWITQNFRPSPGDAHAIQFSLFIGILTTAVLYGLKKTNTHQHLIITFAIILPLFLFLLPWLIQLYPWTNKDPITITSRITIWQSLLQMLYDFPWGVGIGGIPVYLFDYWPAPENALFPSKIFYNVAHNHHLQFLAETGWIGGIWSFTLWLTPTLLTAKRFTQNKGNHFLFLFGCLICLQTAITFLEVTQLFFVPFISSWLFLISTLKNVNVQFDWNKTFSIPKVFRILFVIVVAFLSHDRIKQFLSYNKTYSFETGAPLLEKDVDKIQSALQLHSKNQVALFFAIELSRESNNYVLAEKFLDYLESMDCPYLANRLRAITYHQMGNDSLACLYAHKQLRFSIREEDLALKKWADLCN